MARTPKRLFGPAVLGTSAATKYTVPAVTKTIIRHIHVMNPTGGSVAFTLSLGADAAATRIFDAYAILAGLPFDHFCYYPIEAAEIVQAFASAGSALVLTISGDEYTLG